jgi:hypothetical protein
MSPGISPVDIEELRAQSQRCLIDFLDAEVQLASTFVEAAAMERNQGHSDHARRTKEQARKAATAIRHFIDRVQNQEIRDAIARRCDELDQAVAAL